MGKVDDAGRAIAGLLTYNPGPGLYSRLERAVQQMPENVRVQELPGLLKRYKEGVPGWELKATDLDSTIAGRDVVPREDLLAAVKERSPVYTHREVVLGGTPPLGRFVDSETGKRLPDYQEDPSPLGRGIAHHLPKYSDYGQGGGDYTELLLLQPGARGQDFRSHWAGGSLTDEQVAHARFDTHGDALRINELQSDLGIWNRKRREEDLGDGGKFGDNTHPFPLEDAWSDLLIKRLALEAARKGHRAIEVASPRAIADKVGGNIENYEHFYGKVVPGALERLGRKMGGLVDDTASGVDPKIISWNTPDNASQNAMATRMDAQRAYRQAMAERYPGIDVPRPGNSQAYVLSISQPLARVAADANWADDLRDSIATLHGHHTGRDVDQGRAFADALMPQMMLYADDLRAAQRADAVATETLRRLKEMARPGTPSRYLMSDEMRRRLIEGGVGAAVGTGIMSQDDLIERLNQ